MPAGRLVIIASIQFLKLSIFIKIKIDQSFKMQLIQIKSPVVTVSFLLEENSKALQGKK